MLETQSWLLESQNMDYSDQSLCPIQTFSNRDTQTGLNLQFQRIKGKHGGVGSEA